MNKWKCFLVGMVLLCGLLPAATASAQTPDEGPDRTSLRPSLGSRLNHWDGVLKGKMTVRVVAYAPNETHLRFPVLGKNNKVAQLRLDNEPVDEPFTTMPHEFVWDTARFADGTHVLAVMLLDTETRDTETLDKVVVTLNNGRPAVLPTESVPPPNSPRNPDRRGTLPAPPLSDTPGTAQIIPFDADESKSDHPLMATTTALCKANGVLYLGLKDGGIAACNPKNLTGWAVRPAANSPVSGANAPVKSLCADKNAVYWTTTSAPGTVFRWDTKAQKATAFVLDNSGVNLGAAQLTIVGRKLTLSAAETTKRRRNNGATAYVLDTQTGAVEQTEQNREADANPSAAAATANENARFDFFGPRYGAGQIVPVPGSDWGNNGQQRWHQIGPDIVAQWDENGDGASAYLPWNGANKDGKITAALPDDSGLWIATEKGGVRHITPGKPDAATGYDGYVLVRLSDAPDFPLGRGPHADRNAKMASLVEEWQGTPYLWGGATKKGCDCSGFVGSVHHALGVDVPRSSDAMRASKQGERVHDELHYGDVLVFPGHVALYIGNGKTAETVGGTPTGSVGKSTIWGRREVVVRRYLR